MYWTGLVSAARRCLRFLFLLTAITSLFTIISIHPTAPKQKKREEKIVYLATWFYAIKRSEGKKGRSPSINNFDGIVFFVEFHQILFFSIRILFVSEPQMGVTHFFEAHNAYAHICEQNAIGRKSRKNDVKISIESLNLNVARVDCIAIFFSLQSWSIESFRYNVIIIYLVARRYERVRAH